MRKQEERKGWQTKTNANDKQLLAMSVRPQLLTPAPPTLVQTNLTTLCLWFVCVGAHMLLLSFTYMWWCYFFFPSLGNVWLEPFVSKGICVYSDWWPSCCINVIPLPLCWDQDGFSLSNFPLVLVPSGEGQSGFTEKMRLLTVRVHLSPEWFICECLNKKYL